MCFILRYPESTLLASRSGAPCSPFPTLPSASQLAILARHGITRLSDIGTWMTTPGNDYQFITYPFQNVLPPTTSTTAARQTLAHSLSALPLSTLVQGDLFLALSREDREQQASQNLLALLRYSTHLPTDLPAHPLASDASMIPPSPAILQPRSIAFSVLHSASTYLLSLPTSAGLSIAQREILGLIAAVLLNNASHSPSSVLYADHLNSVRFINGALRHEPLPHVWNSMANRSLYKWLRPLTSAATHPFSITYIRAHTSSSLPAHANAVVDACAPITFPFPSSKFRRSLLTTMFSTTQPRAIWNRLRSRCCVVASCRNAWRMPPSPRGVCYLATCTTSVPHPRTHTSDRRPLIPQSFSCALGRINWTPNYYGTDDSETLSPGVGSPVMNSKPHITSS